MCWVLEEGSQLHTQCPQLVHSVDEVNRAAQRGPGNSPWEQVMCTRGAIFHSRHRVQHKLQKHPGATGEGSPVSPEEIRPHLLQPAKAEHLKEEKGETYFGN